ncbi:MAG: GTPase ObgE [Candidatus Sumerlaeaceae bacterium]
MFVDYAKIHLQAGDGGDGCVSFRREKYVPRGGPDGGDGGRGGHIYLVVDPHMTTLLDIKMKPNYIAKRGQHGGGNQCTGRDAEDVYIKVPLGTSVTTEEGEMVADLTTPGAEFLAAKAGRGGRGNQHFASPTNKAPRKWEYGGDGEKKILVLELKVIADVGLVGLPNAGKSTLLAALTAATPKIGAYPFTTVSPNLGVMQLDDEARCVLADIPGLIEGAHQGAGLGHRFLRHVERTRLLVHLIAPPDEAPFDDPVHFLYAFDLVNAELNAYSENLRSKPQIVCITKHDIIGDAADGIVLGFRERGIEALAISAHDQYGLDALKQRIQQQLAALNLSSGDETEGDDGGISVE